MAYMAYKKADIRPQKGMGHEKVIWGVILLS